MKPAFMTRSYKIHLCILVVAALLFTKCQSSGKVQTVSPNKEINVVVEVIGPSSLGLETEKPFEVPEKRLYRKKVPAAERPLWQIPLKSLVPKKTENLLVAGRCFGFERELVEDARVIATCLVTGQGAGTAAGFAVKENQLVRNLNTTKLKQLLLKQGAWLG